MLSCKTEFLLEMCARVALLPKNSIEPSQVTGQRSCIVGHKSPKSLSHIKSVFCSVNSNTMTSDLWMTSDLIGHIGYIEKSQEKGQKVTKIGQKDRKRQKKSPFIKC